MYKILQTFFHQFHEDQQTGKHAYPVIKLFRQQSISRSILSHCQTNATKVKSNFNLADYLTSRYFQHLEEDIQAP